jgi:predicted ATPase
MYAQVPGGNDKIRKSAMRFLCLLFLLCVIAAAEGPSAQELKDFAKFLSQREYPIKWEFYSLRCFPYLKAKHHPWAATNRDVYPYVDSVRSGSVCSIGDGLYYFGTKGFAEKDSIYMYRAELYQCTARGWILKDEYVVVANYFNEIIDVIRRKNSVDNFSKVSFER